MIETSKIRMDGGTQSRAAINEQTVADYAEAMQDERTVFPPIVVYYDGTDHWLADGFHRVHAWMRIGRTEVPAEIRQGDRRAAILHSCAANAAHGLRRTNEDKRRAVMTLLEDAEWGQWSDREIARRCGVSPTFVGNVRSGPSVHGGQIDVFRTARRGDTTFTVDTSKIGKSAPPTEEDVAAGERLLRAAGEAAAIARGEREPAAVHYPEPSDLGETEGHSEPPPDPHAKLRAEFRKLTREAQEDDWIALRLEVDEQKKRIRTQTGQIADFKAKVKDLEADEKNEVIARLTKQIEHLRSEMFRANDAARVKTVAARKAQDEAKALRKQVEGQEISL